VLQQQTLEREGPFQLDGATFVGPRRLQGPHPFAALSLCNRHLLLPCFVARGLKACVPLLYGIDLDLRLTDLCFW